jgi:hypothetical protein
LQNNKRKFKPEAIAYTALETVEVIFHFICCECLTAVSSPQITVHFELIYFAFALALLALALTLAPHVSRVTCAYIYILISFTFTPYRVVRHLKKNVLYYANIFKVFSCKYNWRGYLSSHWKFTSGSFLKCLNFSFAWFAQTVILLPDKFIMN